MLDFVTLRASPQLSESRSETKSAKPQPPVTKMLILIPFLNHTTIIAQKKQIIKIVFKTLDN